MGNTADPDAYLNSCVKTTEHGFITLSSLVHCWWRERRKKGEDRVRDAGDGQKGGRARTWAFTSTGWGAFFSGGTKALLCNHLSVKSVLCAGYNGAQKQGAGGPAGSVQTQLWAEPPQSGSIWALLTSVAVPAQLPPGCDTMRALSKSFVETFMGLF